MSFVQNFPFFSIILCLVCAVVTFVSPRRVGYRISLCLLSVNCVLHGSVLCHNLATNSSFTYMMGHFPAPWGNELMAGVLEPTMALLFSVVILLSIIGGENHIYHDLVDEKLHLYWVMVDLTLVSLVALSYTNDIFTGYVFIEICTIASCGLMAIREAGRSLLSSVRYMIFALIGSGLFLIGVIFTYSITGQLLFPQLHSAIQTLWAEGSYRYALFTAIGLMSCGLAIKSGCFPFHFWMPETYGHATPASGAILSGVVSKGYIFLLIKIIYRGVGDAVYTISGVRSVLLIFGIIGMIVTSVEAIFSKRLFTMVAYSSAAQIGYIFMGIGMGTTMGMMAAILHIINHAITKPLLFLTASQLSDASHKRMDFPSLRGAGHRAPISGVLFTMSAMSMVGIPLFAGFIPKLYFAQEAMELTWQKWPVLIALAVSTVLNALYFLYTAIILWVPPQEGTEFKRVKTCPQEIIPAAILMLLNLCIGIHSAPLVDLVSRGLALMGQ